MATRPISLITGGAGFIGSHLCDALLSQGHSVICLDNFSTGNLRNIAHLPKESFRLIEHDLTTPIDLAEHGITNISYVYHLASPASPPQYQRLSIETLMVNSLGTKHALDIAQKYSAKFLVTSTSEVYGNPLVHPQPETYWGNVNPNGIRACYDEGKRFAEAMTMEYVRKYHTDARIVRIFNTYGPRLAVSDGRVISNFINQALRNEPVTIYGDGSQTRSFCFVADMVDGLIRLMEKDGLTGEVVNIGYPQEHTVHEIAEIIVQLTGSKSMIELREKTSDDPEKRKPDITKAKALLGWEPTTSLEDGLKKTIEYYRSLL
jgi:nucleoside-diphosphate-sugar epimerase